MEATDARRAFPSFDEPIYKATFDISMTVPVGDTAISNGKVVSDTPGPQPGTHTVTFARTPRMSSYLVALLVGDFVCREGASDGMPIRICSTPDKRELTGFALEAAAQQLKFYNDYFGIKYPFGKLDIIGVPDFSAGAMENIGAITFRERLLLIDPATASIGAQQARRRRHLPRDRAPVVRRSGDDEVVGRHLAERRLRDLDGEQAAGGVEAGMARRSG